MDPKPTSALAVAQALRSAPKESNVKHELGKLFGRPSQAEETSFNPSSVAVQMPKKKKRRCAGSQEIDRYVTAVYLLEKCASIPRKGAQEKLAKHGRIKCVKLKETMNAEDIKDSLLSTFSDCFNKDDTVSSITFFKSYGGNGLAETSVPESGHNLFQIIGHGCLYFLPVQNESVDDTTKLQPTPLRSRHNDSSDEVCFKLALYTMWHGNFCICLF